MRGKIWLGMTKSMLFDSKGYPDKEKKNTTKSTEEYKYYYGERTNRLGTLSYNLEVTVKDDEVVG